MKPLLACLLLATLTACDAKPKKEICVVQQYSPFHGGWDDVILVYGFAENYEEAAVIVEHYLAANEKRDYRIATKTISRREYDALKKKLAKP